MSEKKGFQYRALSWARDHKKTSVLLLLIVVVVLTSFAWIVLYNVRSLGGVMSKDSYNHYEVSEGVALEDDYNSRGSSKTIEGAPSSSPSGIRVVDSSVAVDADDAREEEKRIKQITENYDGYVEESSLSESISLVRIDMKLRVPLDDFHEFFEELKNQTEVEGFSVRDYRIDIERRETDLDTIQKAIEMYSDMLEEVKTMPIERETIEAMVQIVNQEVELRRQENYLVSSLQESRHQSEYSTIRVTVREKVSPKIWPEDLGQDFRENLHNSFQSIGRSITSIIGNSIMVFVKALEWIIYITIVIISLWIFATLLRKIHKTTKK
ncbi:MAG: DUF4349 domain-containing protein [Candidatus Pacebacteria bacterium]|nr:DUF4349 domain-containing protein [Candidatus Paceibacterota bacterium]